MRWGESRLPHGLRLVVAETDLDRARRCGGALWRMTAARARGDELAGGDPDVVNASAAVPPLGAAMTPTGVPDLSGPGR
ncbi:ABATE domain-containing protein [Streptomyces atroolivaceus]|uniref:ABATE domain-containing protein n=1 Tax=Streptomyces atroolivaceus TaxID=66869 RepID=A0ABV9V1J8_STRAZ|nr:ABATE domain-containing protein [Streptomyces atroolivaceus]